MNSLVKAVALALVIVAPVASFAQSNQPLTRAQVRAELVQLEKAGYTSIRGADPYYPANIQAAMARVAAQNGSAAAATDMGGVSGGGAASGDAVDTTGTKPIFFGQ